MNKSNVEYLQRNLKYLGFGTALNEVLEEKIAEGKDEFEITSSAQFDNKHSLKDKNNPKDIINYQLNFIKSSITDNFFLNSYNASLEKGRPGKKLDPIRQTFYVNRGNDVTAKEAYNLLNGRSILKKMEISGKYDLHYINDSGVLASESKVFSIQQAKNIISSNNEKRDHQEGYYELLDKGYSVRTYDHEGKDLTTDPEGRVVLIHEYYDKSQNETKISSSSHAHIGNAIKKIEKIKAKNDFNQESKGFGIYYDQGNVLLFKFDKAGKEVDISPDKRKENIWIKLDLEIQNEGGEYNFKKFYPNYGFDLEKELDKISPVEMKDEQKKERLFGSLQRGNLQLVNLEKSNELESIYIAANPQFKKLDIFDRELKEVYQNKKEEVSALRGR